MRISKLAWVGTRTENAEPTVAFFGDVLALRLELDRPGFWMLKLPDGSKVEVFGPDSPINRHFTTGPVAGFLVDDVHAAADELRAAGVEILLEPEVDDSGNAWMHFRAPDGNIYELTLVSPDRTDRDGDGSSRPAGGRLTGTWRGLCRGIRTPHTAFARWRGPEAAISP